MGRVVIYGRGWEGDPEATEQIEVLRSWAAAQGWFVSQQVRDPDGQQWAIFWGQLGQTPFRPGDVILVTQLSRWAPDWASCQSSLTALQQRGIDLQTPSGWTLASRGIPTAHSEYEHAVLREKIRQGLVAAKAAGRRLGRLPGLHSRTKDLMPTVQDLLQQGYSYRKIAQKVGLSKNTVQAIVKELEQDQIPLSLDWGLVLDLAPGDWQGLAPLWESIATVWKASVKVSVGGETLGSGSLTPVELGASQRRQLTENGSLQFQNHRHHYWVGVVSPSPQRWLWGIRDKPWTPTQTELWFLVARRLGRLVSLWFPCSETLLRFRLPASLQALNLQLRSPITNLRMGMVMLSQAQLTERQRHYLKIIEDEQQNYQEMVRQWQTSLENLWDHAKRGSPDFARLHAQISPKILADLSDFQTDPELLGILATVALRDHSYGVKVALVQQQRWLGWQIDCPQPPPQDYLHTVRSLAACLRGEVIWDPPHLRVWIPDLGGEVPDSGVLIGEDR